MTSDANRSAPVRAGITRFALRGSARLAYEPVGDPDDAARTLVLLHDLLEDRSAFSHWRPDFATADDAASWRVILPDTRGHGASATPGNQRLSLEDLAADVLAVLDAEATARAHIVGHGLGGAIAVTLARIAPERVHSLVLIEPALPGLLASDPDPAVREMSKVARDHWRTVSDHAIRGQTDQALDLLLTPRWGEDWRKDLPRPRLGAIRRHASALGALLAALAADELSADDLRGIACPALVIDRVGTEMLNTPIVRRLVAVWPAARFTTIDCAAPATSSRKVDAEYALVRLVRAFCGSVDEDSDASGDG